MNEFDQDNSYYHATRCHHKKQGGERCGSPAMRGGKLCHYHSETRGTPEQINQRKARHRSFIMSRLRTRAEVQQALETVVSAIAGNDIDLRRAGLLLYSLQIASSNLNQHQNNHFKALPKPMRYLTTQDAGKLIKEEESREAGPHHGTGPRPESTADGGPISTTPGYVSAERKAYDESIPDFTPRPAHWNKITPAVGTMLLEQLGKLHSNDTPLPGTPEDRHPGNHEDISHPPAIHLPKPELIATMQAAHAGTATPCHSERAKRVEEPPHFARNATKARATPHNRVPHLRREATKVGLQDANGGNEDQNRVILSAVAGSAVQLTAPTGCPIHAAVSHEWEFERSSNRTLHRHPLMSFRAKRKARSRGTPAFRPQRHKSPGHLQTGCLIHAVVSHEWEFERSSNRCNLPLLSSL